MTSTKDAIAVKATSFVESHSFMAGVLAVLCLMFAVNYFLVGPGSDGGSGLGGTGKFGGESGFGGTGKGPDTGSGFKLGASDADDQEIVTDFLEMNHFLNDVNVLSNTAEKAQMAEISVADFDVSSLHLTPELPPLARYMNETDLALFNTSLSQNALSLGNDNLEFAQVFADEKETITSQALFSSQDIINGLMLAESATSLAIHATEDMLTTDAAIRNRIVIPIRPERPDRFTIPARITPVKRVNIPAPPPVRPMRTLSTILNR